MKDLLQYLWIYDEHQYSQHRARVQLALSILFLWYMGLRTGEMLESREYTQENEGLLWKDFAISIHPDRNGVSRFTARVRLRNRKGHRGQDDKM